MDDDAGRPTPWPTILAAVAAVTLVALALVLYASSQASSRERPLSERSSVGAPTVAGVEASSGAGAEVLGDASAATTGAAPASVPAAPRPPVIAADPAWTARTAAVAGLPERALRAYASAALTVQAEQPACGIGWNTLAGIGAIESAHGTHSGGSLDAAGYPRPAIRGIPLDGTASAQISDTDGGVWDGDATWDRAVGPLQFIPATWERWGADGNGDGAADPNQIDDAALAAARYLCAAGEMTSAPGWRRAIFSYNHLDSYVDDVAAAANAYAARAAG